MIDDPAEVIDLTAKMEAHLPIPVNPTGETSRQLRSHGLKIGSDHVLFIQRVFYMGDEGGIMCDVTPTKDAKTVFVVSLTHLRIAPRHPLAQAIRAYQQRRVSRIARSDR